MKAIKKGEKDRAELKQNLTPSKPPPASPRYSMLGQLFRKRREIQATTTIQAPTQTESKSLKSHWLTFLEDVQNKQKSKTWVFGNRAICSIRIFTMNFSFFSSFMFRLFWTRNTMWEVVNFILHLPLEVHADQTVQQMYSTMKFYTLLPQHDHSLGRFPNLKTSIYKRLNKYEKTRSELLP